MDYWYNYYNNLIKEEWEMIKKIMKNNLYLILIALTIFVLLISTAAVGCKTQSETQTTAETGEINDISVEEVYEIVNSSRSQDYIILDVRTLEEFREGHIKGAVVIPVQELGNRLSELPKDKSIITYCLSGKRSREAATILVENGFTQVYDMGGIPDWLDRGYPVITE